MKTESAASSGKDGIRRVLREAGPGRHGLQDPAVVHADRERVLRADGLQRRGGGEDQLDLREVCCLAEDVDVALGELAETASLGTVRSPDGADLQRLEGLRKNCAVVRIIAGQRKGQVVAESAVSEIRLGLCVLQPQLLAALQDPEDQLLVVSALLAGQVLDVLHTGRLHRREAEAAVGVLDDRDQIIAEHHLTGENVLHSGHRFLLHCHVRFSVL